MGRQINYFMSDDDEKSFYEFLKEDNSIVLMHYKSQTPEPVCCDSLPEKGTSFWGVLLITTLGVSPLVTPHYVEKQEYYLIDQCHEPVIEWSRSCEFMGKLKRGRLWFEIRRYEKDSDIPVEKPKELNDLYNMLKKWIVKESKKSKCGYIDGNYILPGAEILIEKGIKKN